jgi:hypothetical protein
MVVMPLLESVCAATECADPILALALKILSVEGSKSMNTMPLFLMYTDAQQVILSANDNNVVVGSGPPGLAVVID